MRKRRAIPTPPALKLADCTGVSSAVDEPISSEPFTPKPTSREPAQRVHVADCTSSAC